MRNQMHLCIYFIVGVLLIMPSCLACRMHLGSAIIHRFLARCTARNAYIIPAYVHLLLSLPPSLQSRLIVEIFPSVHLAQPLPSPLWADNSVLKSRYPQSQNTHAVSSHSSNCQGMFCRPYTTTDALTFCRFCILPSVRSKLTGILVPYRSCGAVISLYIRHSYSHHCYSSFSVWPRLQVSFNPASLPPQRRHVNNLRVPPRCLSGVWRYHCWRSALYTSLFRSPSFLLPL